jgi:YcxB-like protein
VRYTYEPRFEDYFAIRHLIVARQSWRRPTIIVLVALLVGVVVFPLVSGYRHSLFVFYMNVAPYAFIILLWMGLMFGGLRPVAIGGVVLFLAVIAWGALQTDRPVWATIANLAPYIFIIALWIGMLWALPALAARAFRRNPMYQGDFTMELTDEEIRLTGPQTTWHTRWSGIVRVLETPAYFLFFYTKDAAQFLPKHAVAPADLPALRTFLKTHLGVIADTYRTAGTD